ncbi:MAG: hypothetical protein Q9196_000429 [Gyalolechia fulgens]
MSTSATQGNEALDACKHYTDHRQMPWAVQKYYHQRYDLFSKYDDGILMTDSAWYGVTPEPVANKIAQHIAACAPSIKSILIDCFAGVGGNAIAFARSGRWKRVYAIEQDENVISCGRHNAKLYGVDQKICWYHGDCFEILKNELSPLAQYSVIFASPPWGGPGYRTDAVFDLTTMQPYSLQQLLDLFRRLTEDIVLFLPRTSDLRQVAKANEDSERIKAIHYCMEGASKACIVLPNPIT